MSFETIKIVRQRPIINGFVQTPNNLEQSRNGEDLATHLIANSCNQLKGLAGAGGARLAGLKGNQEWIELPEQSLNDIQRDCNGDGGLF